MLLQLAREEIDTGSHLPDSFERISLLLQTEHNFVFHVHIYPDVRFSISKYIAPTLPLPNVYTLSILIGTFLCVSFSETRSISM